MEKKIMSLFTRTPLHVGAGNSVGASDAPIMRERHTRIPIIPGSSLKGVLADLWYDDLEEVKKDNENSKETVLCRKKDSDAEKLFGQVKDKKRKTRDAAGQLLIGEARVMAFPVRSAKGSFAWITCPLVLRRLERDADWASSMPNAENNLALIRKLETLNEDQCVTVSAQVRLENKVVLEEYCFECVDTDKCIAAIAEKLRDYSLDPVWQQITDKLIVVTDEIFSYFVEQACEMVTRIRIDDETGTVASGALFDQEQVPSETMFYTVIGAMDRQYFSDTVTPEDQTAALPKVIQTAQEALKKLEKKLEDKDYLLQIGGDETIGLGYCSVTLQ